MTENEIKELESIEKELGIGLRTLFKAFDEGIFIKANGKPQKMWVEHYAPRLKEIHTQGAYAKRERYYKLKDYGKKWALTKDELEEAK